MYNNFIQYDKIIYIYQDDEMAYGDDEDDIIINTFKIQESKKRKREDDFII